MRLTKFITAAAILFSMVSFSFGQGLTLKNITFKKDVFNQSLNAAVKPNVVGYQYVLIKDGKIVTEGADGLARKAGDNGGKEMKMTTATPSLIGSLTKFLSGTALINLMEKENPYAIDKGKTLSQKLDRNFATMLPDVWGKKIQPGISDISFRQLLQHRSGFDEGWKKTKKLNTFLSMMEGEFNPDLYDKRKYANMNFTLGGYLLPLVE